MKCEWGPCNQLVPFLICRLKITWSSYHSDLLIKNKENPKKFWEIVNKVRGMKKNDKTIEIVIEGWRNGSKLQKFQ